MNIVIDEEQIIRELDKFQIFVKEEKQSFINLKESLNNLNSNYKTSNTQALSSLSNELENKFKIIENKREKFSNIVVANVQKYHNLVHKAENIFDKIE